MTILRSDTTSFGLPVACIPQLQAGKTPPRDPKIHGRLGLDPERCWERDREREEGWRAAGGGGNCKPEQASQLCRPQMTVGLTAPQEC